MRRKIKLTQHKHWYTLNKSQLLQKKNFYFTSYFLSALTLILLSLFVFWAVIVHFDEVVIIQGKVIPIGDVTTIQHYDGGIIKKVLVENGQLVKKNQHLIMLDNTRVQAELQQLQVRYATLQLNAQRIEKFLKLEQSINHNDKLNIAFLKQLQHSDQNLLTSQLALKTIQIALISTQLDSQKSEVSKTESTIMNQTKMEKNLREEVAMFAQLIKQGHVSKREYLRKQNEHIQMQNMIAEKSKDLDILRSKINELKQKQHELRLNIETEEKIKLDKIKEESFETHYKIQRLQHKSALTYINAPITGYVQGLELKSTSTIKPGQELLRIVPHNLPFEVVAQIPTNKIADISIGDKAKIKIDTFNFMEYGYIKATISAIGASSFQDEHGNEFYKIRLQLAEYNESKLPLKAGMSVTVDIITGSKSLLNYLLRPLQSMLHQSFYEK